MLLRKRRTGILPVMLDRLEAYPTPFARATGDRLEAYPTPFARATGDRLEAYPTPFAPFLSSIRLGTCTIFQTCVLFMSYCQVQEHLE